MRSVGTAVRVEFWENQYIKYLTDPLPSKVDTNPKLVPTMQYTILQGDQSGLQGRFVIVFHHRTCVLTCFPDIVSKEGISA